MYTSDGAGAKLGQLLINDEILSKRDICLCH